LTWQEPEKETTMMKTLMGVGAAFLMALTTAVPAEAQDRGRSSGSSHSSRSYDSRGYRGERDYGNYYRGYRGERDYGNYYRGYRGEHDYRGERDYHGYRDYRYWYFYDFPYFSGR
jgi:hypothetical protein